MGGEKKLPDIKLPARISSRRDLIQTARELEKLRDELIARKVKGGEDLAPQISDRLRALFEDNNIIKMDEEEIQKLKDNLEYIADRVPQLRFIFAGEPEAPFIRKLVLWVRQELHPAALVLFSVQPQLAGGFILTTDRARYDLSWRYKLREKPMKLGPMLRRMEKDGFAWERAEEMADEQSAMEDAAVALPQGEKSSQPQTQKAELLKNESPNPEQPKSIPVVEVDSDDQSVQEAPNA